MTHNAVIYILVMFACTYMIRAIPLIFIRGEITNRTVRSFLYYVPYVTLAVMTFPAIVDAAQYPAAGYLALVAGIVLAYKRVSLMVVCFICSAIVLLLDFGLAAMPL